MRAQPERGSVFGFRLGCEATPGKEVTKRRPCFRPIGIEALRGGKFGCRALEALAVGSWLAGVRYTREQRGSADAHATIGIGQERCDERPELVGRYVLEHRKGADSHRGIGIR